MKKKNINDYIKRLEEKLKEKCKGDESLERMKDRIMVIKQILDNWIYYNKKYINFFYFVFFKKSFL